MLVLVLVVLVLLRLAQSSEDGQSGFCFGSLAAGWTDLWATAKLTKKPQCVKGAEGAAFVSRSLWKILPHHVDMHCMCVYTYLIKAIKLWSSDHPRKLERRVKPVTALHCSARSSFQSVSVSPFVPGLHRPRGRWIPGSLEIFLRIQKSECWIAGSFTPSLV
jgi:hypothetical protein